jgi:hypothetical protein
MGNGDASALTDGFEEEIAFRVDREDRIVWLSAHWQAFAAANGDDGRCAPDRVLSRPLWNFIDGFETQHLYRMLIDRVRQTGSTVTLEHRCDAPDRRRLLEMTVSLVPENCVAFTSRLVTSEPRPAVRILQEVPRRDDREVLVCSVCRHVRVAAADWREIEAALPVLKLFNEDRPPRLRYKICRSCNDAVLSQLVV